MRIPQKVIDKYNEAIDMTIRDLGVVCQLVFVDDVEVIDNSYNNIPENRSMNIHRRVRNEYKRDNKTIRQVETTSNIQMKVYWNSKEWIKNGGDMVIPDGSIQTVFWIKDLNRVNRAKELIAHNGIIGEQEMRFTKLGQPFPVGFGKNKHFVCFWERS